MTNFIDDLPIGVVFTSAQGTITEINERAAKMLSLTKEKALNEKVVRFLPETTVIKSIKTGFPQITSVRRQGKPSLILYESSIKNGRDASNGMIVVFHETFIEQLAYYGQKTSELRQELDLIMNLVGELVTVTDANGTILKVNEACERIMGVKKNHFIGKPMERLEEEKIVDTSSTKKVIQEGRKITIVQTTKSGRRLLVTGHPIYNEEGKLTKVINISKDITETEELSTQLQETKQVVKKYQLELLNKTLKEMEPIVKSKTMKQIYEVIERIAELDLTVLFLGEPGVGKEFFAQKLHEKSSRSEEAFVKLNCGAVPEETIESVLFGSKETKADSKFQHVKGLIEKSQKGTLFIDEIEKLPLHIQTKLVQMLQEEKFTPSGFADSIDVDVRIVAATSDDLKECVQEKTFRSDLYYMLSVAPIHIPSMRERKEEIPFFIDHFLNIYNDKYGQNKVLTQDAKDLLLEYKWPGNVREVQNTMERLVVTVSYNEITKELLPKSIVQQTISNIENNNFSLKNAVQQYERDLIASTLNNCTTMKEASAKLGVDASTLSRKISRYDLKIAKMQ